MPDLFDTNLLALRRDRAARVGEELFLQKRAFEDCLDRLSLVQRRFAQALLFGCPDPDWRVRLSTFADRIDVVDPGPLFAAAADGEVLIGDEWLPTAERYDLVVAVGTLETINDLPKVLVAIRLGMRDGGLFLGALSGGDTLPQLRAAMRSADAIAGGASPHVHPRIEAAALAPLLSRCRFINPVVDVDRVRASYPTFERLVSDLRRMAATNILLRRSRRGLTRAEAAAASRYFLAAGEGGRTTETFEIVHFACWTPERMQD